MHFILTLVMLLTSSAFARNIYCSRNGDEVELIAGRNSLEIETFDGSRAHRLYFSLQDKTVITTFFLKPILSQLKSPISSGTVYFTKQITDGARIDSRIYEMVAVDRVERILVIYTLLSSSNKSITVFSTKFCDE
ncbi:MAG: hypothetical protein AB7I27_11360 [Bacteriovoracaceae bacterium]